MGILREHSKPKSEPVPAGWKTALEWAEEEGLSIPRARTLILELVRTEKWEMKKFRIQQREQIYPAPHYRPRAKKK